MPISIGSNIASLLAQRRLSEASSQVESIYERLSSGMRINRASDDAAGLAISDTLRSSARFYSQGIRNLNDGISALSVAQGALQQLGGIVDRQMELSEQSANGVYSLTQRKSLHNEANELTKEFNRIISTASFNGTKLLDGSWKDVLLQAGIGDQSWLRTGVGSQFLGNRGDGTFTAGASFSLGAQAASSVNFDIDGDGDQDLVQGYLGGTRIFLNNGDGTFTLGQTLASTSAGATGLSIGDFNGDGKMDVVSGTSGTTVNVWINNGDGSFATSSVLNVGAGSQSQRVEVGDFNGDGILDLLTGSAGTGGKMFLFTGNGSGGFSTAQTIAISTNATVGWFAISDINNDGKLDVYFGDESGSSRGGVMLGNGDGTFRLSQTFNTDGNLQRQGLFADLNNDGILDIAYMISSGNMHVRFGRGDGTFGSNTTYTMGNSSSYTLSLKDIDGDGYLDATTVGDGGVAIRLGNSDGTFRSVTNFTNAIIGNTGRGLTIADFDGDGLNDIFASSFVSGNGTMIKNNTYQSGEQKFLYLLTQQGARETLDFLRTFRDKISRELGVIGSHQSRIGVATNHLSVLRENYLSANSRILDTDVAEESSQLVRTKILQQVASSVLAQANMSPSIALKLLGN